jgi:5-formyltetrahydrofolate cyclo-ligase
MDKVALRRSLLQQRQSMSVEVWREWSDRLCAHLQASLLFQQAQTVLTYSSFRQEPDLSSLVSIPKVWGLPRCVDRALVWHQWSLTEPLQAGTYGILEPQVNAPILPVEQVDLILVPCVACDRQKYRLGYGGGYYDRLFSQPAWTSKLAIGIVFEFGYLPLLPFDEWDRPLTAICTETGFIS